MEETATQPSMTEPPVATAADGVVEPALAETHAETQSTEAHGSSGMPQMDPSSFPSQLFWLTVCFVTLYVVLAKRILPRIQDILETRQNRITGDIGRADEYKKQAADAKEVYERALADSRSRAQTQLAEVADLAHKKAAARQADLDAVLVKQISEAEGKIATARKDSLSKMTPVATELASLIVEKFVHHKPAPDKVAAIVNALAKEKTL